MLVLSRHRDEHIGLAAKDASGKEIGISITVVDIRGDKVRLGIHASPEFAAVRTEITHSADPGDDVALLFKQLHDVCVTIADQALSTKFQAKAKNTSAAEFAAIGDTINRLKGRYTKHAHLFEAIERDLNEGRLGVAYKESGRLMEIRELRPIMPAPAAAAPAGVSAHDKPAPGA